jgi:hypothetical protein
VTSSGEIVKEDPTPGETVEKSQEKTATAVSAAPTDKSAKKRSVMFEPPCSAAGGISSENISAAFPTDVFGLEPSLDERLERDESQARLVAQAVSRNQSTSSLLYIC